MVRFYDGIAYWNNLHSSTFSPVNIHDMIFKNELAKSIYNKIRYSPSTGQQSNWIYILDEDNRRKDAGILKLGHWFSDDLENGQLNLNFSSWNRWLEWFDKYKLICSLERELNRVFCFEFTTSRNNEERKSHKCWLENSW